MPTLQATTELEAVNTMLGTIGDSPISTLEVSSSVNAETAKSILHEISREIQMVGWHFNSEENYPITPDVDGHIQLPLNVLKIDTSPEYAAYDVVWRGTRVYDRYNHTYVFDKTLKFDIVFFLAFTELPESARRYITVRAARVFGDRQLGSEIIHTFSEMDENEARAAFLDMESNSADHSIFNHYDVLRTLDRKI